MMDTSLDRTLRINRIFLSSLGQWPEQSHVNKTFWFIFAVFFLATQGYLQTGGMIAAWCDPPIFMESIPPVLISLMCLVKFINFLYNADKMKTLLDMIKADWASLTDEAELKILSRWATDSRKNTIMYAGAVYGSMIPFMLGPLVPLVMALLPEDLLPINGNATMMAKPVMFHVEYLIDIKKYYFPLVIHSYFGTWIYITVVVAIDSMFMVYVQHACAIFDLIGYRLEHLVKSDDLSINVKPNIMDDKPYQRVIECVIRHSQTLESVTSSVQGKIGEDGPLALI